MIALACEHRSIADSQITPFLEEDCREEKAHMNGRKKSTLAALTGAGVCSTAALAGPMIQINEIRVDQVGSDINEYFELSGPAGTDLTGLTYLVIGDGAAGSGVIEAVINLDGLSIAPDGFFVATEDSFDLNNDVDLITNINFENGDNVTHLLVDGFSGADGDDLDTNDDGVLDAMPWTSVIDVVALVETVEPGVEGNFVYAKPLGGVNVGPDDVFLPAQVYRCVPDGNWEIGNFFDFDTDTPGDPNLECGVGVDCNNNGVNDIKDINSGFSDDCNGNLIPDECEEDCNNNGVADECDITDGTSNDCNFNGIPDECEPDCNRNGIPDSCDIFDNTSEDCNSNGVPDECDIANGTSMDRNGNGIPDECEGFAEPPGVGDLIVTEILKDPLAVGDGDGEWFEIYNTTEQELELAGLVFMDDGSDTFQIPGTQPLPIAPGAFFVLGVNGDAKTNGGAPVDFVYDGFNLSNADDEIVIRLGATEVDRVNYDDGAVFPDPTSASLNLDPSAFDANANNDGTNWCTATTPFGDGDLGTPGADNDICEDVFEDCNDNGIPDDQDIKDGNSPDENNNGVPDECEGKSNAQPGDLIITEIMQNPSAVSDTTGEWFEIFNDSARTISLQGLEFKDEDVNSFTITEDVSVGPGEFFVLGRNADPKVNGGVEVDYEYSDFFLANGDDEIIILNEALEIDRVEYDGGNVFPDPNGASMNLEPMAFDVDLNDLGFNWCEATMPFGDGDLGTPGGPNTNCEATGPDSDGDGVPDEFDNCPETPNFDQADSDLDGVGNVCDNCPSNFNPAQGDCDNDGSGDVCEIAEGTQEDANNNGIPDECEIIPPANLMLNEIRINQPMEDTDEYVELAGDPGTDLTGVTYVVIGPGNPDTLASGVIEAAVPLDGVIVPSDGFVLIAEDTFFLTGNPNDVDLSLPSDQNILNLQNSGNQTHLLVANFSGKTEVDLDVNDDGVLDDEPWTEVIDAVGILETSQDPPPTDSGFVYTNTTVGPEVLEPDQVEVLPGHVFLCPTGAPWLIGSFEVFGGDADDTPGAPNPDSPDCKQPDACPEDTNNDDIVDVTDLLNLLAAWGTADPSGDINMDGTTDVSDLLQMLGAWGACP